MDGWVRLVHAGDDWEKVPVHVHIVAAKVKRDEELEDERIFRIDRRKIAE